MTQCIDKKKTGRGTSWRGRTENKQRKDFRDQLNGYQRAKLKIFGGTASESTNIMCIFQI